MNGEWNRTGWYDFRFFGFVRFRRGTERNQMEGQWMEGIHSDEFFIETSILFSIEISSSNHPIGPGHSPQRSVAMHRTSTDLTWIAPPFIPPPLSLQLYHDPYLLSSISFFC